MLRTELLVSKVRFQTAEDEPPEVENFDGFGDFDPDEASSQCQRRRAAGFHGSLRGLRHAVPRLLRRALDAGDAGDAGVRGPDGPGGAHDGGVDFGSGCHERVHPVRQHFGPHEPSAIEHVLGYVFSNFYYLLF